MSALQHHSPSEESVFDEGLNSELITAAAATCVIGSLPLPSPRDLLKSKTCLQHQSHAVRLLCWRYTCICHTQEEDQSNWSTTRALRILGLILSNYGTWIVCNDWTDVNDSFMIHIRRRTILWAWVVSRSAVLSSFSRNEDTSTCSCSCGSTLFSSTLLISIVCPVLVLILYARAHHKGRWRLERCDVACWASKFSPIFDTDEVRLSVRSRLIYRVLRFRCRRQAFALTPQRQAESRNGLQIKQSTVAYRFPGRHRTTSVTKAFKVIFRDFCTRLNATEGWYKL